MAQTGWVLDLLRRADPGRGFEVRTVTTRGDTDGRPLFAIDQKGIFEREVNQAVSEGLVDFAVHSLKDVPSRLPPGLVLACVPRREPPNDVLVSGGGGGLASMGPGSVVGTSSLRRAVLVSARRPDLRVRPVRGNVETRIGRSRDGTVDAVVLARAGLARLGILGEVRHHVFPTEEFPPSPGQGALAFVCRKDDARTRSALGPAEDPDSRLEVEAERALSAAVDSGCRFPVGAHARIGGRGSLTIRASAFSADGATSLHVEKSGPKADAAGIGARAGQELYDGGAGELASGWREKVEEWNSRAGAAAGGGRQGGR